jgi:hypothetical protein
MRIPVPHSDSFPLVSIILFTPKGEFTTTLDDSHYWVDIPLPEGVQEDEVDVYSCFLGADHRPPFGCGPALLKAATRKPESVPALAVESAPVVEPALVAPAQEPESAPASEPASADEPEADANDEPVPADGPAPVESESAGG